MSTVFTILFFISFLLLLTEIDEGGFILVITLGVIEAIEWVIDHFTGVKLYGVTLSLLLATYSVITIISVVNGKYYNFRSMSYRLNDWSEKDAREWQKHGETRNKIIAKIFAIVYLIAVVAAVIIYFNVGTAMLRLLTATVLAIFVAATTVVAKNLFEERDIRLDISL